MDKEKKPRLIKRYQNRKLYDTAHSCYVTLEEIEEMLHEGEDIVVVDNKTNEDLTSLTLTQIILEQEKKKKNLLPLDALKNIIRTRGEQIATFFQKSLQSVSSISSMKGEAGKVIGMIKDEIEDGGALIRGLLAKSHQGIEDVEKFVEEKVKTLGKLTHLSSLRSEIRNLRKKAAFLERKITLAERSKKSK